MAAVSLFVFAADSNAQTRDRTPNDSVLSEPSAIGPKGAAALATVERVDRRLSTGVTGEHALGVRALASDWEGARHNAAFTQPGLKRTPPAPLIAPVASILIPGAGQALLRQQRSVAYAVVETFLILRASRAHRDFERARNEYRGLASDLARAPFGADRPVGSWDYYEAMEKFVRSGTYNSGTGGQFIPESDTSTYNGKQWELARGQYWVDPNVAPPVGSQEYQKALQLYQRRAYSGSFQWSWLDNGLSHTAFRESIDEANMANQRYVTAIGFVAANHLVSLIDSYITVRLRRYGGAGLSSASLTTELRQMGHPLDRQYGMRVSFSIPVTGPR